MGPADVKELYAKDPESTRKEAEGMESVTLNSEDLEWVHVLAEGWASPLDGSLPSLLRGFLDIVSRVGYYLVACLPAMLVGIFSFFFCIISILSLLFSSVASGHASQKKRGLQSMLPLACPVC